MEFFTNQSAKIATTTLSLNTAGYLKIVAITAAEEVAAVTTKPAQLAINKSTHMLKETLILQEIV